jgi:sigma-E factor negative regulatory protein RseC
MTNNSDIRHIGFVKSVSDRSLIVSIINQSGCASCHAKGACTTADLQEKEVEINNFSRNYSPGEMVTIVFRQSQGFAAVFWGYLLPFLLVFLTLLISNSLLSNELTAGLLSLFVLIPYYIALYFFRHLLKKYFKFELEENN